MIIKIRLFSTNQKMDDGEDLRWIYFRIFSTEELSQ